MAGNTPPTKPTPGIIYQPAFAGGIMSPSMRYRADMEKWRSGLAECSNMFVLVQGGVCNRPGTQYVGTCKQTGTQPTLIPFIYNSDQAYVLELGDGYIRFITAGAYLLNADGSIYEVVTPYSAVDARTLRYAQSADVMTLTHSSYAPMNLSRLGATDWTLTAVTFGAGVAEPTGITTTDTIGNAGNTGTTPGISQVSYEYTVTAASLSMNSESNTPTGVIQGNYNISYWSQYGNYNTVSWSAVSGADYYNVYRKYQGSWGLIGSTTALSFDDQDYKPDTTTAPPTHYDPLSANFPSCVAYYQQRRVFAGSVADPQTVWMTRSGNYTNMDVANPVKDDDAITATIASNQVAQIKHVVMMADLLAFTSTSVYKISSGSASGAAITPANFTAVPQMYIGCSDVRPITVNYDVLFVEGKGSHVRDIQYDYYAQTYTGNDLSIYAEHLFYGYTISGWAFAQFPFNLLWALRNDGTLLGMTYLKEQNIYAWHQHSTTNGVFLGIAVIPETTAYGVVEDTVYFITERTINGTNVFYIERLATRQLGAGNDQIFESWFLDCALKYSNATATATVTGLSHLEGQTVTASIDGYTATGLVVSNGTVTLPVAGNNIVVGLPYTSYMRTLPLALEPDAAEFSRRKRVSKVYAALYNTSGATVSLDGGVTKTGIGSAATSKELVEDVNGVIPPPQWTSYGQVDIYQTNPLPLTVVGLDLDVTVGN